MQPALVAIWLSVAFGAALGIGQRWAPRVTEPIRTFAVVAAALVVSLSLLPHALGCEGMAGLAGAVLGYGAIPALERLGVALFRRADPDAVRLELGYSGLLLHRFGDGVAMSVDGHGSGVLWALGAHEVPIVALVTLAFARRGLGVALGRAVALGWSSSLGYWLVSALSSATWHALHGWADAIAAGVLVHVIAHEGLAGRVELPPGLAGLGPPRPSVAQRALDLAAALLACVLIGTLGLEDESGSAQLLRELLQLALAVAPWLCLGLVCRATLRLWSEPRGAGDGARFWPTLEQGVAELAGWTALGLLAATYAATIIAKDASGLAPPARVGWSALATVLAYVSAPAAAPLAAALAGLGLPFGAALAVLLLGPLAKLLSSRSAALTTHARSRSALLTLGSAALAVALLWNLSLDAGNATQLGLPRTVHWLLLLSLLGCVVRRAWAGGVRGWLQTLAPAAEHGERAGHAHAWHGHT